MLCLSSVPQLKEQATDSIMVLEGALKIKKDFYIHTLRTLDLLAADPSTANGETESSTAGLRISADELHCQVGCIRINTGSDLLDSECCCCTLLILGCRVSQPVGCEAPSSGPQTHPE